MKWRCFMLVLIVAGCDSGGGITEVGNPTTITSATAITSAANQSVLGTFPATANADTSKALDVLTQASASDFNCAYDTTTGQVPCTCPGGGTATHVYEESLTPTGDTLTLDHSFTTTYDACVVSACGDQIAITGQVTSTSSGSVDVTTGVGTFTVTYRTAEDSVGITVDGSTIGFNMNMSHEGSESDFRGSICIDGTCYIFTSLAQLLSILDPAGICPAS